MKNKSQNKYQTVEDLMEAYCAQCKSKKSDQCLIEEKACGKFESKYKDLYFELLYPEHPCRFCIVRPTCDERNRCEDYKRHQNMRNIANSEVKSEEVGVELSKRCIGELKWNPLYAYILETERQYFEYRSKRKGSEG
jgi:hypothetical protein